MTVASVRAVLGRIGTGPIREVRPGVVRIDVCTRGRQKQVMAALDAKTNAERWHSYRIGRRYPWPPWRTWITVEDSWEEWHGPRD
ncbi:hypothetical protein [Cryptosporangium minutisporangium]|uniref:hypothetical protein n=1 Tax=Cryptosporangium minutisporangium TaxID=113569 RepID=UPI0031E8E8AA